MSSRSRTVVILGAGATAACGGPVTDQILPLGLERRASIDQQGMIADLVVPFLNRYYGWKEDDHRSSRALPSLTLFMSAIDIAIERKQPFGPEWPLQQMVELRRAVEFLIFKVLTVELERLSNNSISLHREMLEKVFPNGRTPRVISLNYDVIIDNAMIEYGLKLGRSYFPDYSARISTRFYARSPDKFGSLLKLHGSLNFKYCANCQRLAIALSDDGRFTRKALADIFEQYDEDREADEPLAGAYTSSAQSRKCTRCGYPVQPILVSPTHRKDYRNAHLGQIWMEAERQLRQADNVHFVGYSLPEDDTDVFYLFKRALSDGKKRKFTVIQYAGEALTKSERALIESRLDAVKKRYEWLLGAEFDWRTDGFAAWIDSLPPT